MRLLTTIDTIWIHDVLRVSSEWTTQISYESVALLQHGPADFEVQMSFYSIAAKYNGPLEAAHALIDDDRYDMGLCGAAGQPKLDLSDQLRLCSIASTYVHKPSPQCK